jgi:hypothetical protein
VARLDTIEARCALLRLSIQFVSPQELLRFAERRTEGEVQDDVLRATASIAPGVAGEVVNLDKGQQPRQQRSFDRRADRVNVARGS